MEWKGRRQSDNIEDQRGASPGGNPFGRGGGFRLPSGGGGMRRAGGGMSFGTIIFLVVLYFILKAMGIYKELAKSGAQEGHIVKMAGLEFEYVPDEVEQPEAQQEILD